MIDIIKALINLFIPADCALCGERAASSPFVLCARCDASVRSNKTSKLASSSRIPVIYSLGIYSGALKECIKQFKFRNKINMIHAFCELIRSDPHIKAIAANLIIPVPISGTRFKVRQYNQSELIARILQRILKTPLSCDNLVKTKNTPPQTGLSRNKRIENLIGSFHVRDPRKIAGRSILLVDDVITTGATLDTCAKELLLKGAKCIYAFTLARTPERNKTGLCLGVDKMHSPEGKGYYAEPRCQKRRKRPTLTQGQAYSHRRKIKHGQDDTLGHAYKSVYPSCRDT